MQEKRQKEAWEDSEAHRACLTFITTDRMHRRLFERMVAELGIHRSQHFLLMNIAQGGAGSQKELASRLDISGAAAAVALKKLEAGGYIERTASENDNRNNEIRITDRGKQVIAASRDYIHRLDEAMFRGIDNEMLTTFVKCLDTMQRNLSDFAESEQEEEP